MSSSKLLGKEYLGLVGYSSSFNSAFNIAQVCLTWFVYTYTRSAAAVGIVAIVESLAVLLISLPVGTLIDRVNKGGLLFVAGLIGAVVLAILSYISNFTEFNLYVILALAALWGISREISRSAGYSSLPDVVPNDSLSGANGIFRALTSTLGSVSNAAAGGLIVALGVVAGFSFSAGAYLLASLFAGFIIYPFIRLHMERASINSVKKQNMYADLREGFKWLVGKRGFFLLTISATFFNFFITMTFTFYVIYVASALNATSLIYGFVLAALAAGDVVGSLIPGRVNLLKYTGKINTLLYGGVTGVSILILGLFPNVATAIALTFIIGVGLGLSVNVWLTSAHNIVPSEMRGRYFALDGVLTSISPVSIATGALVISLVGVSTEFVISGVLMLLSTLVFSLMKSFWNLDGRYQARV